MVKLLIALMLAGVAQDAPRLPAPRATFSGLPRLQVLAVSPEGAPLGGVTLTLCESRDEKSTRCVVEITNPQGEASFEKVPSAEYRLKGELSGFASTMVFPLSIAASDPVAPDRVVLLLNPVCWHC
jgi:hypothetical protein